MSNYTIEQLTSRDISLDEFRAALKTLPRETLLELRTIFQSQAAEIRAQIDDARGRYHASGQRSDPMWFRRANSAARFKGTCIALVESQIAIQKQCERAARTPGAEAGVAS